MLELDRDQVRKQLFYHFYAEKQSFCQDRLGTNTGKNSKKDAVFRTHVVGKPVPASSIVKLWSTNPPVRIHVRAQCSIRSEHWLHQIIYDSESGLTLDAAALRCLVSYQSAAQGSVRTSPGLARSGAHARELPRQRRVQRPRLTSSHLSTPSQHRQRSC